MSDDNDHIETHGDFSPGYVEGDFKVTKTTIHQYSKAKRKRWRSLNELIYPALIDDEDRRAKYGGQLALHLHRVFKEQGYRSFCGLLRLRTVEIDPNEEPIPVYCLITHEAAFSGELRHTWKFLRNQSRDLKDRSAYQDELNEELNMLISTWALDIRVPLVKRLVATQFTYDPEGRMIKIGPPAIYSTTPSDYRDKVRTTSELLVFLSCIAESPFMNIGDIEFVESHYPLFKLVLAILDSNGFHLDRIRVNTKDNEDWDYINTAADAEIGRYSD